MRDRLEQLADIYAVDVYAFAVMSNHLHVVMRVDPGKVATWSDHEVEMAKEAGRKWFCLGRGARELYATDPPGRRVAEVSG